MKFKEPPYSIIFSPTSSPSHQRAPTKSKGPYPWMSTHHHHLLHISLPHFHSPSSLTLPLIHANLLLFSSPSSVFSSWPKLPTPAPPPPRRRPRRRPVPEPPRSRLPLVSSSPSRTLPSRPPKPAPVRLHLEPPPITESSLSLRYSLPLSCSLPRFLVAFECSHGRSRARFPELALSWFRFAVHPRDSSNRSRAFVNFGKPKS